LILITVGGVLHSIIRSPMKTISSSVLLFSIFLFSFSHGVAQTDATALWQVTSYDINANIQQAERNLNATVTINAVNVGRGSGSTFTVRLNSKASVKAASVAGAATTFRGAPPEARAELQRVVVSLPATIAPNQSVSVTINYTLPVEINTGLMSVSPIGSQFLPLSFWYPTPNSPYTLRGPDTAPFKFTVNLPNVISSGMEKSSSTSASSFEQALFGQPFFLQGDWDKVEGVGDGKGIVAYLAKGASAEERKRAESLISYAASARAFFTTTLGPAPDVPVRLVSTRRGAGFSDSGTVLLDADVFRLPRIDSATALSIAETVSRLWVGGQTPIRGEGGGVLRDGLARFLANQFLEKEFGRDAAEAELLRQRVAFAAVAKRDSPLARANTLDSTYYGSVPNRGAMVWRLISHKLGRDAFLGVVRGLLQSGKADPSGFNLAGFRAALGERGGESLRTLLDQQLDQVTDMDLMIGLPQARGAEWVSALRNLGSTEASVTILATTEKGERVTVQGVVPARNFADVVFRTPVRIVRVEIDPEKLYPQLDFSNDVAPKTRDITEALADASLQMGAQDYVKAESISREVVNANPRSQDGRILLARALLGQNKLDEAEKLFRAASEEPLPTTATLAWASIGLGEIGLKRGQAAEAAKRFNEAVISSRDYPSSLAARAARIRAETAANNAPAIDESAKNFITQLSQVIVGGKKSELDTRIVSGELVRFVNGLAGTPTELWETRVLRTEMLDANLLAADVAIKTRQLGRESHGTAVLLLSRTGGGWKLSGIELFEVR
jgi:tetratricopeptide (TPR) repeat protein